MKTTTKILAVVAVPVIALSFNACEVKQTKEAEMPEVKVEGGQAPEFDVETAEVEVEEKKIEIPDSITVPDVDVVMPSEQKAGGNDETGDGKVDEPVPTTE